MAARVYASPLETEGPATPIRGSVPKSDRSQWLHIHTEQDLRYFVGYRHKSQWAGMATVSSGTIKRYKQSIHCNSLHCKTAAVVVVAADTVDSFDSLDGSADAVDAERSFKRLDSPWGRSPTVR
jgi:hypothetical protein